jgi:anti-anti-sigma regulatory factor
MPCHTRSSCGGHMTTTQASADSPGVTMIADRCTRVVVSGAFTDQHAGDLEAIALGSIGAETDVLLLDLSEVTSIDDGVFDTIRRVQQHAARHSTTVRIRLSDAVLQ